MRASADRFLTHDQSRLHPARSSRSGQHAHTAEGKVTLHGELHSWAEREEAEHTARAAPGVTQVENLITIAPRIR